MGYSEISKEHIHKAYKYLIHGHKHGVDKNYGKYESMISTDSGGVGMLLSLSNVKRMDLLAHPSEVQSTHLG